MRELFKDIPEACDNTLEIAERCNVMFDDHEDGAFMPQFDCPEGWDETSLFLKKVEEGLERRYDGHPPIEVLKQADYECGVICQMQFCGYFLVVADYINWAKSHGVMVGPGRGSAAGAMVAYAMGITELDPIKHGLIFERFLNPERVSLPDIDVDFDPDGRGRVLDYVGDKYGRDKVAQCVIYGTIKTKQALKDSARIMGYEFSMGERITKALPPAQTGGKDIPLHDIFEPSSKRYAEAREFRELYDSDPDVKRVTDEAMGIEGLIRQTGVHACATIMGSEPISNTSPLLERTDGTVTTTLEYHTCETLGLVKMDFLGLSNLTVIRDTLNNIEANGKTRIDHTKIPLDDRATYDLLSRGDTLGVFQLDSDGMRSLLKTLKPNNFNDISALIALYRPGPKISCNSPAARNASSNWSSSSRVWMMPDGHPEDAIMPFEYLARISLSIRGYRMTRPSRFASVDAFIRLTRPSSVSAHIVRWVIRPPPDTSLGLRLRCCGSISGFQLVSQLTRV
jgi:DNA polymerase III subunit alpha